MPFYHYSQNNSGGNFIFDKEKGITHHVVIEASDATHADQRAIGLGIYFNGCDDGTDCDCCGGRWYNASEPGDKEPVVYGEPIKTVRLMSRFIDGPECVLHPLNGGFEFLHDSAPNPSDQTAGQPINPQSKDVDPRSDVSRC